MDDTRFDAWTRRRFGLAAGGLAATVLGLAGIEDAQTRKKRKKRCKRLGASCKSGGKRTCCGTLRCDRISFEPSPKTRCCRKKDQPCVDNHDCCAGLCCQLSGTCGPACLMSDRNLKTNFGSVDPADMLYRVRSLPIATWKTTRPSATSARWLRILPPSSAWAKTIATSTPSMPRAWRWRRSRGSSRGSKQRGRRTPGWRREWRVWRRPRGRRS